jgi:F-type H+-transporting ATPase subunit epsilon|tara:strand:- start:1001 stop:1393 length:393 start_codon:yes stop_codon:yes gene_type:complete
MSENFTIEIVSPSKLILKSEVTEVTIPSYEGQMGILKDHIPLITFLRPGIIDISKNSENKFFFVEEGTVEFMNNNLLILSSTIKSLKDLDKNSIDLLIKNSEKQMSNDEISDKEKYLLAYKIDTLREINQ